MVFYHQPTNLLKKIASTCRTLIIPMVLFPLSAGAMEKDGLPTTQEQVLEEQISQIEVAYIDSHAPDIPEDDTQFTPYEEQRDKFLIDEQLVLDYTTKQSYSDTELEPAFGLALDGGGMRGLISARWLLYFRDLLKDAGYNIPLSKVFKCVGGTSIGGILSLFIGTDLFRLEQLEQLKINNPELLINNPDPYDTLTNFFLKHGEGIFPPEIWNKVRLRHLWGFIGCRYSSEPLRELLQQELGSMTLNDASTNVIVTSCTTSGQPKVFKSFAEEDKGYELWKVGLCTSAAPTYFRAFPLEGQNYVDGGLWMNNPSPLVATSMVKELHGGVFSPQNLYMLSLGTGEFSYPPIPENARLSISTAKCVINLLTQSNSQGNHETMKSFLGNNYYRVNCSLGAPIDLAAADKMSIEKLEEYANQKPQRKIIKSFAKEYMRVNRKHGS